MAAFGVLERNLAFVASRQRDLAASGPQGAGEGAAHARIVETTAVVRGGDPAGVDYQQFFRGLALGQHLVDSLDSDRGVAQKALPPVSRHDIWLAIRGGEAVRGQRNHDQRILLRVPADILNGFQNVDPRGIVLALAAAGQQIGLAGSDQSARPGQFLEQRLGVGDAVLERRYAAVVKLVDADEHAPVGLRLERIGLRIEGRDGALGGGENRRQGAQTGKQEDTRSYHGRPPDSLRYVRLSKSRDKLARKIERRGERRQMRPAALDLRRGSVSGKGRKGLSACSKNLWRSNNPRHFAVQARLPCPCDCMRMFSSSAPSASSTAWHSLGPGNSGSPRCQVAPWSSL